MSKLCGLFIHLSHREKASSKCRPNSSLLYFQLAKIENSTLHWEGVRRNWRGLYVNTYSIEYCCCIFLNLYYFCKFCKCTRAYIPNHISFRPFFQTGVTDNSGIRFYHTPTLRPNDAGILEVGVVYSPNQSVPPNSHDFVLTGYCTSDCTKSVSKHVFIIRPTVYYNKYGTGSCICILDVRTSKDREVCISSTFASTHTESYKCSEQL